MVIENDAVHRLVNLRWVKRFLTENRWITAAYFNFIYRSGNPYRVDKASETAKFDHAFSMVAGRKFERALEIGCGEGDMSSRLASFCGAVRAVDISRIAIQRARHRFPDSRIDFGVLDLVADPLDGTHDYVFCSETLFYLNLPQLEVAAPKIIAAARPGGLIHLIHGRCVHDEPDATEGFYHKPFGAKTIHAKFAGDPRLIVVDDQLGPDYRITLLQRDPRS